MERKNMTRAEQLTQAWQSGRYARENGRSLASRPGYGITPCAADLRKAWTDGFEARGKTA